MTLGEVMAGDGSIMALDPGKTVGVAWGPLSLVEEWDKDLISVEEVPCDPDWGWTGETAAVMKVLMRMREMRVRVLAVETFNVAPGRVLTNEALVAVRFPASLMFALEQKWWTGTLVPQGSSAMSVVTNDRLKDAGLWKEGAPHARDAIRHLVVCIRKIRNGKVKLKER